MSDVTTLEPQILSAIASAADEAALEAVRVGALGKSGSVSALLKTLDRRKECRNRQAQHQCRKIERPR